MGYKSTGWHAILNESVSLASEHAIVVPEKVNDLTKNFSLKLQELVKIQSNTS